MSDTDIDPVLASDETAVAVPSLVCFEMEGVPTYVVRSDKEWEQARQDAIDNGRISYYVLAADDNHKPTIYRVTNNMASLSLAKVETPKGLLHPLKETAWFQLPKIPWALVTKIDAFFRKIDADLGGSEAIVILAFDDRHTDSSGWRVIVPEQTNNAGACNYVPYSIVESIPDEDFDHVQVVGTCHSHPRMSAFCSGTDKGDQAQNDGLHITFGWTTGATQFHAELQASGMSYKYDSVDAIFEPPPALDFPEFKEWASRVTKSTPPALPPSNTNAGGGGYTSTWGKPKPSLHAPDPDHYTVVFTATTANPATCAVCLATLGPQAIDNRRCPNCMSFFRLPGESIEDIRNARKAKGYTHDLHLIDPLSNPKDIALWHRDTSNVPKGTVSYISAKKGNGQGK